LNQLWSEERSFFLQRISFDGSFVHGRELIGYFPWAFNLPPDEPRYSAVWSVLLDSSQGFAARYGPTTLERRNPYFMRPFTHPCLWNGPSWPYSTTLVLRAMANVLSDYPSSRGSLTREAYYQVLSTYSNTQRDPDGSPMVREDHHPDENRWIAKGANYNHSGFADLVITGLLGVRPQADDSFVLNPTLIPRSWAFFCLEDLPYHGHLITVLYDRDGSKYSRGSGLQVMVDKTVAFTSPDLAAVNIKLTPPKEQRSLASVSPASPTEQGRTCWPCCPWTSASTQDGRAHLQDIHASVV
jgi:hypothetical protein